MKKVLFLIVSIVILGLVFAGCSGITNITAPGSTTTEGMTYLTKGTEAVLEGFPLFAGQDMLIGKVLVWDDGEELCVRYELSETALADGWLLYETHWAVADDESGIPQTKKNNPIPGQFPYGDDNLGGVDEYQECISFVDLGVACGDDLVIAVHAVVKKLGDLEGLDLILPDQAYLCIDSQPGPNGYFGATISGGTVLDGFYDGYCIDTERYIDTTFCDWVEVYSTYEELPSGLVDYSENLDLVNYIMNQDYIGKAASCGGVYTPGDVQQAIWQLVDLDPSAGCCEGPWEQCRVDEILADAAANGEGYEPVCGEKAVVLLVPTDGSQPIIIIVDVPCEGDETAWGATVQGEIQFPGKNWATYFNYTVECPLEPELLETIIIDPSVISGIDSTNTLENGVEYEFKVSGTWENRSWERVDAKYCSADYWVTPGTEAPSGGYPDDLLELFVDEAMAAWGAYSATHEYTLDFTGDGSTVNFAIYDSLDTSWYSDNINSTMQVEIWTK
ncbi:MAG: thioester domain-containing protein [Bacteroidetes bacterium]|nr:thioester domain-containing protein [Bacteroidota bacterium]